MAGWMLLTTMLALTPVAIPDALSPGSDTWTRLPGTRAVYQSLFDDGRVRRVWIGMREAAALRSARPDAWAFTIRRTEFDCRSRTLRLVDGVAFARDQRPVQRLGAKPAFRVPRGTEAEAQLEAICSIL